MPNEFEEKDFSEGFNFDAWKKIGLLFKRQLKYLIILIVLQLLIALSEVVMPLFNRTGIDKYASGNGSDEELLIFVVCYFVIIVATSLTHYIYFYFSGKVEMNFAYDLRDKCFRKLHSLSFSYFDTTPTGWLMARMTSDISRLAEIIAWSMVDLAWGVPIMIFSCIVMFSVNAKLALLVLMVIPLLAYLSYYFQIRLLKSHRQVRKINSRITNAFSEGINGAKTTKTLHIEDYNYNEFLKETDNMKVSSIRTAKLGALYRPLVHFISSVSLAFIVWYGAKISIEGMLTFGTLVLFIQYAQQFYEPIRTIAVIMSEFQMAQASGERIVYLLDQEPTITDTEEVIEKYGDTFNPKISNYQKIKGDIEFKDVSFSYIQNEKVLEHFNLKINAGETVALVGETGSGKSTIVNLICRFYEPSSGSILIDGEDYRTKSIGYLHSNLGYVLQAPHLFSGSIMDNIRYGRLNASDEEVYEAAKLVRAHDFIIKFDEGYNTDVGEGGSRLSTGQKQLISFARAVLSNPSIFVLDEATSSIDTETEKIIQYAIENIMRDRTSLVVAHRLSTIVNADVILVIKDGKIVERGKHQQLLDLKGYYYRLYTNQFNEDLEKIR